MHFCRTEECITSTCFLLHCRLFSNKPILGNLMRSHPPPPIPTPDMDLDISKPPPPPPLSPNALQMCSPETPSQPQKDCGLFRLFAHPITMNMHLQCSAYPMAGSLCLFPGVIQQTPVDCRRGLYKNITLSGGSTMFQHFGKRCCLGSSVVLRRTAVRPGRGGARVTSHGQWPRSSNTNQGFGQ